MRLSFGLPSCTCEGRKTGGLDVVSFWQTQWLGCREHEALVLDIRPTCCYLRISRRSSSCMPRRRHANTPEGEDEGEQVALHSIRHTNGWQTRVCDQLLTTISSRWKPTPKSLLSTSIIPSHQVAIHQHARLASSSICAANSGSTAKDCHPSRFLHTTPGRYIRVSAYITHICSLREPSHRRRRRQPRARTGRRGIERHPGPSGCCSG